MEVLGSCCADGHARNLAIDEVDVVEEIAEPVEDGVGEAGAVDAEKGEG